MNCSSDEEDGFLSDDDDILDPNFEPLVEGLMESGDIEVDESQGLEITEHDEESVSLTTPSARKLPSDRILWQRKKEPHPYPELPFNRSNENYCANLQTPYEFFKNFISDELMEEICFQSNLYASRKNPNQPLNLNLQEFEQWLGICMRMSITKISHTRLHWSALSFNEKIKSLMSRKRWETIKANLHLVDNANLNANDKLAKVRLLIDHLQKAFREIPKEEHLCVDEQMVPFKGASSLKQYIPKKPTKWGYKMFLLAGKDGLIYDFFPFTGSIPAVGRPDVPDLGASSNSVLILCETIPTGKNHKIYFDNWFTSVKLVEHLATRGIWACGTVQERRLRGVAFTSDKDLKKNGRGSFDEQTAVDGDLVLTTVKWFDNRPVSLLSSFLSSQPIVTCQRWDKKEKVHTDVSLPNIVSQYNQNMGGVDSHDQMMAYFRMSFKSKKYYMRLVFHLIDMVVVNSWNLMRGEEVKRKVAYEHQTSLCEFKLLLSDSLMMTSKDTVQRKRGRSSDTSLQRKFEQKKRAGNAAKPLVSADIRKDGVGHWPSFHETRGTCKYPGCNLKKHMFCMKCEVHLCCDRENNCFYDFHND